MLRCFRNSLQRLRLEGLGLDREAAEHAQYFDRIHLKQVYLSDFVKLTHLQLSDCDVNLFGQLPEQLRVLDVQHCRVSVGTLTDWFISDIGSLQEVTFKNTIGATWSWLRYFLIHDTKTWENEAGVIHRTPRALPYNLTTLTANCLQPTAEFPSKTYPSDHLTSILQVHGATLRWLSVADAGLTDERIEDAIGYCRSIIGLGVEASQIQISSAWLALLGLQQTLKFLEIRGLDCSSYDEQTEQVTELQCVCDLGGVKSRFLGYVA